MSHKRSPSSDIQSASVKRFASVADGGETSSSEASNTGATQEHVEEANDVDDLAEDVSEVDRDQERDDGHEGDTDEDDDAQDHDGDADSDDASDDDGSDASLEGIDYSFVRNHGPYTFVYGIFEPIGHVRRVCGVLKYNMVDVGSLVGYSMLRGTRYGYSFYERALNECYVLFSVAMDHLNEYGFPRFSGVIDEWNSTRGEFLFIKRVRVNQDHRGKDLGLRFIKHLLEGFPDWGLCMLCAFAPGREENGAELQEVAHRDRERRVCDHVQRIMSHFARLGFRQCEPAKSSMYLVRNFKIHAVAKDTSNAGPIQIQPKDSARRKTFTVLTSNGNGYEKNLPP